MSYIQTNRITERQIERQAEQLTNRPIDRPTCRLMDRETDGQTERQDRETDRQTDRQTKIQRELEVAKPITLHSNGEPSSQAELLTFTFFSSSATILLVVWSANGNNALTSKASPKVITK